MGGPVTSPLGQAERRRPWLPAAWGAQPQPACFEAALKSGRRHARGPPPPHQDVELAGALHQRVAHRRRHLVTLGQQLLCLQAPTGRVVRCGPVVVCMNLQVGDAATQRVHGGAAPPSCIPCGLHVGAGPTWYCATTALSTSLPMEGSTRSSQSVPRFCGARREGVGQGVRGRDSGARVLTPGARVACDGSETAASAAAAAGPASS